MTRICVVIPFFNHGHAIEKVVLAVLAQHMHCILVDDGSSSGCAKKLDMLVQKLVAAEKKISLVRLPVNSGKGAAVIAGIQFAAKAGYTHALQIDADGQHCIADIPRFTDQVRKYPEAVVTGRPMYDASVPKIRLYARYLTHTWVWVNTLSFQIHDSMCGFRVYPIAAVQKIIARKKIGQRMNFDTDILVRLYWDGLDVINVPTRVTYPDDGVSHFRLWSDNVLITRMHVVLFLGMLPRIPTLIMRKIRQR